MITPKNERVFKALAKYNSRDAAFKKTFIVPAGAADSLSEPEAPRPPLFTRIGELLAHPQPVDWLVKGWLERDTTAALIAEPGRGKSFAALDMASPPRRRTGMGE